MPLRLVKRGRFFYIRGTVRGQSVFETTGTAQREEAELCRAKREAELYEASVLGTRAAVSFQRAALSYLEAEPRSEATLLYVRRLADHFGALPLGKINNQDAADRAVDAIVGPGAAPATKNRGILVPLLAILHHAAWKGWCDAPRIKKRKVPKPDTPWLPPAQAVGLMEKAAPHLQPLLRFLLCTGARLSEALDLTWADVDLPEARVIFRDTKAGNDRVARLPPAAVTALANLPTPADGVRKGSVFLRDDGEPYADRERLAGGQIKTAWATACRRAGLLEPVYDPKGNGIGARNAFTPHDLRHTWASYFYAVSKDPMLLRDEGGWASISMVERYAHLMPSEMAADVRLIWGPSHPRIGTLPTRAKSVQSRNRRIKTA